MSVGCKGGGMKCLSKRTDGGGGVVHAILAWATGKEGVRGGGIGGIVVVSAIAANAAAVERRRLTRIGVDGGGKAGMIAMEGVGVRV